MRKLIIIAASFAALAIPTAAMATVNYDATGHGSVSKGDVQSLFGWNNSQMEANAPTIKFAHQSGYVIDYTWDCKDGSTPVMTLTQPATQSVNATPVKNSQGKVVSWNLTGYGATTYVQSSLSGAGFLVCAGGTEQGTNFRSTFTPTNGDLQVNASTSQ